MDRLALLPSTIEKVGTEFVNPTGTWFSNPIVISFTTHFRVLMCQHIWFTSMQVPILPSILPLYWVTLSRRHNAHFTPHVSDPPLTKGLWRTLPPQYVFYFFNTIKLWAPSWCDKRLLRESMKIINPTSHVLFQTDRDFVLMDPLVSPPSRDLPRILVNCFLGRLRDCQSPSARREWLPARSTSTTQNFLREMSSEDCVLSFRIFRSKLQN